MIPIIINIEWPNCANYWHSQYTFILGWRSPTVQIDRVEFNLVVHHLERVDVWRNRIVKLVRSKPNSPLLASLWSATSKNLSHTRGDHTKYTYTVKPQPTYPESTRYSVWHPHTTLMSIELLPNRVRVRKRPALLSRCWRSARCNRIHMNTW